MHRTVEGKLETDVYRKPTHTDKYLSYDSHHPVSHKRSVAKTLLQRAESLPSNSDSQANEREYVLNILGENDYPKRFLNNCLRSPVYRNQNNSEGDTSVKGYAIVTYIQGVTEPIKRILSNCNIKVALKPYLTLGHIFAKPKDPVKTNQKTHAVYSIPCGDCEKEYLGQSKRQFGTRLKEHQKAVSTLDKGKSALAEHVCYTKHEIAWDDLFARGIYASHWQVTSSLGYLRSHDCNFRSPLMKTLDWSVETLGLDYNSTVIIYLNQSSERNMIDIPGCSERTNFNFFYL